jgi:hypothetical protein
MHPTTESERPLTFVSGRSDSVVDAAIAAKKKEIPASNRLGSFAAQTIASWDFLVYASISCMAAPMRAMPVSS